MPNENARFQPHSHIGRVHLVDAARVAHFSELLGQRGMSTGQDNLFFWDAEISNDLLDSHYTHMSEKTLTNYAEDANRGVAFLRGHDWKSLPVGYSLSAVYEGEGSRKRVMAGFYTVRGLQETDDLIARMTTGLLRDVSVGFHGGRMICDICGADFWDCRHFPGLKYEEKEGDTVRTTLSTFEIDDAHLSEVSGVFDGSTPEAMIRKAERMARLGELTSQEAHVLESRYRIALPLSATFRGVDVPKPNGEKSMNEEQLMQVRTLLALGTDGDVMAGIEAMSKALADAQKRVVTLEVQAAEGAQYRNDLVQQALEEGVRAQGGEFDRSLYETLLKDAPLSVVKRMRDDWKKTADLLIPTGRKSKDEGDAPCTPTTSVVPDSAFRV